MVGHFALFQRAIISLTIVPAIAASTRISNDKRFCSSDVFMAGVGPLLASGYGFMDQNSGYVQISNVHSGNKIRENSAAVTTHESDLAHRWWTLPRKSLLPLSN